MGAAVRDASDIGLWAVPLQGSRGGTIGPGSAQPGPGAPIAWLWAWAGLSESVRIVLVRSTGGLRGSGVWSIYRVSA
jgi:hypothetical protein